MTAKNQISEQLGSLTESELEQLAQYLAFLKFKARSQNKRVTDEAELAALYQEASGEDQDLAEVGMTDYTQGLAKEDNN